MFWIFILFLVFAVAGCYVAYKEAKVHELHKMRAAFENKRHEIEKIMEAVEPHGDNEEIEILKGEILGFEKATEMLKKDGADEDLVYEIKKDIEALKIKIRNIKK